MSEFRIVKKSDIPNVSSRSFGVGPLRPQARLHKGGTLFLSVMAVEPLQVREDCYVLAEFDEASSVLKLSVPEKLPRGVSESDCFVMRVRKLKGNQRPMGMLNVKPLLGFIGFKMNGGGQRFEIAGIDAEERSISLTLPAAQLGESHEAADAAS